MSLLSYLCGGRASHVLTETFDVRNKLSIMYADRGTPTIRMAPPVPLNRLTQHARLVVREMPKLAERFKAIYESRLPDGQLAARRLDAVLHHYAEGVDSAYPTTRILRLAVAFEALVNLVTGDTSTNEAITSKAKYRRMHAAFNKALSDMQALEPPLLSATELRRFQSKLDHLNLASNTQRMSRFWNETKVAHTKTDDDIIRRLRNDSVHEGFVGDESSRRAILKNLRDSNRLMDLFNRAFLAYLGYRGPVLGANETRWMHARSGRRFVPEPVAAGPRLQLEITTTVSPMCDSEVATAESLNGLPRRSTRPPKKRRPGRPAQERRSCKTGEHEPAL